MAKPRLLFVPSMSPRTRALYPARHLETLRRLANVTCLPHLGAATAYCREAMGAEVLDNLRDYLAGRPPRSRIGQEQALRMSEH